MAAYPKEATTRVVRCELGNDRLAVTTADTSRGGGSAYLPADYRGGAGGDLF
jgi:hypothetical protein